MAYADLVFLVMLGFNSAHPLGKTEPHHLSPMCPGRKCPPGYSSFCLQNGPTRCIPCEEGTFSSHTSRRTACRPCSRCNENEFELRPCTATSNVVCKKCRPCPPGFGRAEKSRERTRGRVCEKCHRPVELGDVSGIEYNKTGSQITDDVWLLKRRKQGKDEENVKDSSSSVTAVEVKNPWPNGTNKPIRHQDKISSGFEGVRPTSSNSSAASVRSVKSHSVDSVSPSTRSALAPEESIDPSFSPMSNHSTGSNPKRNTKRPLKHVDIIMQGDEPNVPRHTRRNAKHNDTRIEISVLPPLQLSKSPLDDVKTKNMLMGLDARGVPEEMTTTAFTMKSDVDNVKIPMAENEDSSGSKPFDHRFLAVVVIPIVAAVVLVFIGVSRSKLTGTKDCFFSCRSRFRPKRPRCPGSSDCCDGHSEAEAYEEQTESKIPVSVRNKNEAEDLPNSGESTLVTYLQTQVTADVHRSVFDLFPALREQGNSARAYPQFVTQAADIIDSTGGRLSAPGSNVSINVESGAVPDGVSQPFFFGVVYDDTLLLRDIPETPERSLICPVIQCGPEDIKLLKPVDIVLPHCLYVDEVKKSSISVYRCEKYCEEGPMNWEKVPSATEKTCQSKAWFTIKKNTIHIRTKTFSFWSVFTCGGPKRKRATVFVSRPNPQRDLFWLRFYIYSDNEDSKKRMERKEKEQFPDSKPTLEKPFKMYNDSKHISVWLNPEDLATNGWVLDQTPATQTYTYEMAYRNGYRSYDSCNFAVKPITTSQVIANDFSCKLNFKQEDHPEHFIYVNPGIPLASQTPRFSVHSTYSEQEHRATEATQESSVTEAAEVEDELGRDDEMVTQDHCHHICNDIGVKWKPVLRHLGLEERALENVEENWKHSKVDEKCYQGLLEWVRNFSQKATTRALCKALRLEGCSEALETLSKEGVRRSSETSGGV